jgi:hypothetical protein
VTIEFPIFQTGCALFVLWKYTQTPDAIVLFGLFCLGFAALCAWLEFFRDRRRRRELLSKDLPHVTARDIKAVLNGE